MFVRVSILSVMSGIVHRPWSDSSVRIIITGNGAQFAIIGANIAPRELMRRLCRSQWWSSCCYVACVVESMRKVIHQDGDENDDSLVTRWASWSEREKTNHRNYVHLICVVCSMLVCLIISPNIQWTYPSNAKSIHQTNSPSILDAIHYFAESFSLSLSHVWRFLLVPMF